MVRIGDDAPDFTLPALDGLTFALHEATGDGPVVLVFWQAHCGACKIAAPYWNRLCDAYENIGWSFWMIAQDAADEARSFAEQYKLRPPVLVDGPMLSVSDLYDPEQTPTIYVIEPGQGITVEAPGFDKDVLNDVSRRIAGWTGEPYVEVAPPDDGNPAFKPG